MEYDTRKSVRNYSHEYQEVVKVISAGHVFGRLTVIDLTHMPVSPSRAQAGRKLGARAARCRCECGRETVARIYDLERGNILSCGCLRDEGLRERSRKHGHAARHDRHPLYGVWQEKNPLPERELPGVQELRRPGHRRL